MTPDHTVPGATAEDVTAALRLVDSALHAVDDGALALAFPHDGEIGPQSLASRPDRVALARRLLTAARRLIDPDDTEVTTPADAAAVATDPGPMPDSQVKELLVWLSRTDRVRVVVGKPDRAPQEPEVVTLPEGGADGDEVLRAMVRSLLIAPLAELTRRLTELAVDEHTARETREAEDRQD